MKGIGPASETAKGFRTVEQVTLEIGQALTGKYVGIVQKSREDLQNKGQKKDLPYLRIEVDAENEYHLVCGASLANRFGDTAPDAQRIAEGTIVRIERIADGVAKSKNALPLYRVGVAIPSK